MSETHREILRLALPSVAANITVPLLGLVDTTIVGHLGRAEYIAAIAVGTTIFNMSYWLLAFLRMGTTGLVAQAVGQFRSREGQSGKALPSAPLQTPHSILCHALLLALALSLLLLLARSPILRLSLWLMPAEAETARFVAQYFHICIWGAPAMLSLFVLNGWFIGCQDTRSPMWVAIGQNVLNIILSLWLVFGQGWKIEGVAVGTLAAQWCALGLALMLAWRKGEAWRTSDRELRAAQRPACDVARSTSLLCRLRSLLAAFPSRFFRVNRDIFLRTLCLVAVTVCFTSAGTRLGGTTLAANALLMQLFILYSYFTDGLANAAEALSGKYAGARNHEMLHHTVHCLFMQGAVVAAAFSLLYLCGGRLILRLLTDRPDVIALATAYLPWTVAIPIIALQAMVWDGVFIGLTWTRQMLLSMFAAACVFFALSQAMPHLMPANHALWLAFDAYLLTRGAVQTFFVRRANHHLTMY